MLIHFRDLPALRTEYEGRRIVFGGGVFDLLHRGHLEFLQGLRKRGDLVVVGVSSDANVHQRKGPSRPVIGQTDRVRLIEAMKYVDAALVMPATYQRGLSPSARVVKSLRPDVFVSRDRKWFPYVPKIEQFGTQFIYDTDRKTESTSRIIKRIIKAHA
jgi:cytidyltransferase-like protein